jgi:hypothetical protein
MTIHRDGSFPKSPRRIIIYYFGSCRDEGEMLNLVAGSPFLFIAIYPCPRLSFLVRLDSVSLSLFFLTFLLLSFFHSPWKLASYCLFTIMSPFSLLFSFAFLYVAIFVGSTEALLNMFEGKSSSTTSSSIVKTGAVVTVTKSAPTAAATTASSKAVAAAQATSTVVSPLGSASDVFLEGGACKASWIPASGSNTTWQNMTIDLMTGSNLQMVKLATVAADIDGTDPKVTSYLYACPNVSPNAAIYFLVCADSLGK